jgi:hypothetical protein
MSTPDLLARTDPKMIENMKVKNYFKYLIQTALGVASGDMVR